jgi:predicted nucleotidyltransferase
MFKILNTAGVRYLIVGAHAVSFHVEPRTTKDLDIWVDHAAENVNRLYAALAQFGAPLEGINTKDFCNPEIVYQIGLPPNRIDIIMGLEGISFEEAWHNCVQTAYGGERIFMIGREDLIKVKRIAARPQDLEDVQALEAGRKAKRKQ